MAGNANNVDEELNDLSLQAKENDNETPVMQDGEQVGIQQDPSIDLEATGEAKDSSQMADGMASYDPEEEAKRLYPTSADQSADEDAETPANAGPKTKINGPNTPVTATAQDVANTQGKSLPDIKAYLMKKYNIGNAFDDDALQDAQKTRNLRTLVADLGEGAATIASGLTGQGGKIDSAFYDKQRQQAGSQVLDLQQRQKNMVERLGFDQKAAENFVTMLNSANAADENNPNGALAISLKAAFRQQAPKLYAQLPPEEVAALTPAKIKAFFADYIKREDDQTARHEDIATKVEANKALREANQIEKSKKDDRDQERYDTKLQAQIGEKLNTLQASSRKVLGTMAGNVRAADSVLELTKRTDLTPQDFNGLIAPDMSRLITGQVSVAGAQANEYHTLKTKLADLWGKFTSNPTAANMPEVRAHISSIAQQMQQISNAGIDKNTAFVGTEYSRWINKNPENRKAFINMAANVYGGSPDAANPSAPAPASNPTPGSSTPSTPQYKVGDTKLVGNVTYVRTPAGWVKQ
jgi:hypothetical protein